MHKLTMYSLRSIYTHLMCCFRCNTPSGKLRWWASGFESCVSCSQTKPRVGNAQKVMISAISSFCVLVCRCIRHSISVFLHCIPCSLPGCCDACLRVFRCSNAYSCVDIELSMLLCELSCFLGHQSQGAHSFFLCTRGKTIT